VWLRATVDSLTLQFSYSLNGEDFINIAGALDCSNLSDEAYSEIGHEGHTGTFIGVACQDLSGLRQSAYFKKIKYMEL
jgi:xylan 1,4-beta-xylosidase